MSEKTKNEKTKRDRLPDNIKDVFLKSLANSDDSSKADASEQVVNDAETPENTDENAEIKCEENTEKEPESQQTEEKTDDKKVSDEKPEKPAEAPEEKAEAASSVKILSIAKSLPFIAIVPSVIIAFIPMLLNVNEVVRYAIVALFWVVLLFWYVLLFVLKIRNYSAINNALYSGKSDGFRVYRFLSCFNFFRNRKAMISDIVFVVSLISSIILLNVFSKTGYDGIVITAIAFAVILLSFNYHVYFNDSIYEYMTSVKNKLKIKDVKKR